MNERVITVFGSSRPREDDADYKEAFLLGLALGKARFDVCTGGYGASWKRFRAGQKWSAR